MFAEMQVEDIAKAGCDPINLTATVETIRKIVVESARSKKKTICFVTGVPGAGKTLAGLRTVHDRELRDATGSDSVFLTGNLPLVKVLQAALARDMSRRRKTSSEFRREIRKQPSILSLDTRENIPVNKNAPHERIVIFDEAQRAWDADRTAEYLTLKLSSSATLSLLSCWQYSTGSRGPCLSPWWEADRKSTGVKQDCQSGDEQSMKGSDTGLLPCHQKRSLASMALVRSFLNMALQTSSI